MDKHTLGFKGSKMVVAVIVLLTFIHSVSILYIAIGLAETISSLFAGQALQEQVDSIAKFLLAFFIRQLTAFLMQKIAYRYAETAGRELRKQLVSKLFQFGPRLVQSEGTGNVVTLVLDGIAQFRTYVELIIPRMIGTAITPIIVLGYVCWLDPVAAIILAVTMPILIIFMILLGLATKTHMGRQWKSYRLLSNHFVDSLRGLETLKVLGQSKAHSDTIERVSDSYRSATIKTLRMAFLSSFALDFFTTLSVAMVAVNLGLRLIEGDMVLYPSLLILILAPEYFLPIRMVGADYHATLKGKEAGKAIRAVIEKGEAEAVKLASSVHAAEQAKWTWTEESTLTLKDVGLKHEAEGPASLDDIHLTVQGMKKIGVIGTSGAGKSTLIDILGGFLAPSSGDVQLNGEPIEGLMEEGWRQQLTYIPQQPYLYNSSLADNVRFYTPDASEEDVKQAIAAAGLERVVARLPQGMDEVIGNGGRSLSGGQEQRIALARAFLSQRPIILLDEPTAHLDIETEYELKETMLPLFENKLVLMATHRLHWMTEMDWVIVLEHGRIAETGTHEELLERKGLYYEMMRMQMEGVGEG
ncbi:thiol reductant ABC exporter subunit CydD [Paenibacillus sp. SC116]|uniref:thiol reductant ABC exporter subunit CydD n=1 Tax=Paenibacillus sp. SC116 TaxID=2968986 RepID=UPI00215B50C1|nr:thiol reductant ABC exporter subunit CydD [Paenibacillus sp. SC116]MCR8844592.1 thiol reductant ABC exporter subunit CydD [Paenibacillus sp. SC116]